jgi:hypothetical protein
VRARPAAGQPPLRAGDPPAHGLALAGADPGAALGVGFAISAAILVAAGVPADELANEFVVQTFFDGQNLRAVLFQAAPMILVGLAGAIAFRARFWNLGWKARWSGAPSARPPSRCGRSAPSTCACR